MNKPQIRFWGVSGEWEQRELGELYNIYSGQTPFRGDIENFSNPTTAWIKTTDLNNASIISNEENISNKAKEKLRVLPIGTVLVAMYGGFNQIGRTGLLTYPTTINQAISALPPVNEVDSYFLMTELNHRVGEWKIVAASSRKDPNITKSDVMKFKLLYPSIEEQKKIGGFVHTLDITITLHQKEYEKIKNLKKAMLEKMFPKAGSKIPAIRFEGFSGEWQLCKIGGRDGIFDEVTRGEVLATSKISFQKTDKMKYPVYSSQTKDNGLMGYYSDYLFDTAITWTTDGANAGTVNFREGKFYSTNVNGVLLSKKGFANQCVAESLNLTAWKYVSKVGNPKLMNNIMTDISIMLPNLSEQIAIDSFFKNLDETISFQKKQIEHLQNIKKSLLEKMFV